MKFKTRLIANILVVVMLFVPQLNLIPAYADDVEGIIYEEDFEDFAIDTLPTGYTVNSITGNANTFRTVKETQGNKYLSNTLKCAAKTTSGISYGLGNKYTGVIDFSAKIYTKADAYDKSINLLNGATDSVGARIMNLHFQTGNVITVILYNHSSGSTKSIKLNAKYANDVWTDLKITLDTINGTALITVGDNEPEFIPLELKNGFDLSLAGFYLYNYYRAAASYASYLNIDDILIKRHTGNNAPAVNSSIDEIKVPIGEEYICYLTQYISDIDGDTLYFYSNDVTIEGNTIKLNSNEAGTQKFKIYAYDKKGGTCAFTLPVNFKGNSSPVLKNQIKDQYIMLGDEVFIDLDDVFHDENSDKLTISADYGEIENNLYRIKPDEIGEKIVTITAKDPSDEKATAKFKIVVNNPDGSDYIIYKNDFETTDVGSLPAGYSLSLGAALTADGFINVNKESTDSENKVFYINHNTSARGTLAAMTDIPVEYEGDYCASFDMYFGQSLLTRYVEFLNDSGNVVFSLGFERDITGLRLKVSNDLYAHFNEANVKFNEFMHVEMKYTHNENKVELYLDDSYVGYLDLTESTVALKDRNLKSIRFTSYIRSAASAGHIFLIDNILIKGNIDITESDMAKSEKDYNVLDWYMLSNEKADSVTLPLDLITKGVFGSNITWESSNPGIIAPNGMVARDLASDKIVYITAAIRNGNAVKKKTFAVSVLKAEEGYLKNKFFEDFEDASVTSRPDGWTFDETSNVLNPDSDVTIVEKDGNKYLKQLNRKQPPQTYNGFTGIYEFDETYEGHVVFETDYMVDSTTSESFLRFYNSNKELIFSVGNNSGFAYSINNTSFNVDAAFLNPGQWYKFKIDLYTDTGYVIWSIDGNKVACFKCNENLGKNYTMKHLYLYSWVRAQADGVIYLDNISVSDNLTSRMEKAISKIEFPKPIIENITFPENYEDVFFTYSSSDENMISFDGCNAIVNRDLSSDKNVNITITALINGKEISKTIPVTVKKAATDEEKLSLAYDTLTFDLISDEDINFLTKNISLVDTVGYDSHIEWKIEGSGIKENGNVIRGEDAQFVKLTAKIDVNGNKIEKVFNTRVVKDYGTNISDNQRITSYSAANSLYPVENVNDGNTKNIYKSPEGEKAYEYIIDLGVKQKFDRIVYFGGSNIKNISFSTSNDYHSYQEIANSQINSDNIYETVFDFSCAEGRYVKVRITPHKEGSVQIKEIGVFNTDLSDSDATKYDKALLKIENNSRVQGNISLPTSGIHGSIISWTSEKPDVIDINGNVVRGTENVLVKLTATIIKGDAKEEKTFECTVIKNDIKIADDPTVMPPLDVDTSTMSDEEFFGVWDSERGIWNIKYMPKLDYEYNDTLRMIGEFVKSGDYESAKSELVTYYKNKNINYHITLSSNKYEYADLLINNIMFSSSSTLAGEFRAESEEQKIEIDLSSYIKGRGDYTVYFVQKYKHENGAEFYTKESGDKAPKLTIVSSGKVSEYNVLKDTYISPCENIDTNYGSEPKMYVKESSSDTGEYEYEKIWTNDTKRSYLQFNVTGLEKDAKIDSAVLTVYGSALGGADILVWGSGNTVWKENVFTWNDSLASVFSWNGEKSVDWNMPKGTDGSDNATYMNLARVVWLQSLAGCYNTSNNEYYAYHSIRQLLDMIKGFGGQPGAYNLQDAGIRSGTMIAAFNSLKNSDSMTTNACMALIKYFWQLNKTLTFDTYFAPAHNHGVYSNRGQMRITLYFPEFSDYEENFDLFVDRWNTLASNMVKSDGSYVEATHSYTNEVVSNFMSVIEEAEIYGFEFDEYFNQRLINVSLYLASVLYPDGSEAAYGDGDNASCKTVLSKVAEYFDVPELKYILSNGKEGTPPDYTSIYYGEGTNKYLVSRDDWSEDAMMVSTNYGIGDAKSHTHYDNMALTFYAYNKPLLVDNGRYNYTSNNIADWLRRTTESHNVVTINGKNQLLVNDVLNQFIKNEKFDYFEGTQTSVRNDAQQSFEYTRGVMFPKSKYLIVSDRIKSPDNNINRYDQNWHFMSDSNWEYDTTTGSLETHFEEGANLIIAQVDNDDINMVKRDGYYSPALNKAEETKFPSFRQEKSGYVNYDTVVYPKPAGDDTMVSTNRIPLDTGIENATAFEIGIKNSTGETKDVYYKSHESVPAERIIGNYTYSGKGLLVEHDKLSKIASISMFNAGNLKQNGKTIVDLNGKSAENLYMTFNNDELIVYTSSSVNDLSGISIYAPTCDSVLINDEEIVFTKEGEYIVIGGKSDENDNITVTTSNGKNSGVTAKDYEKVFTVSNGGNIYEINMKIHNNTTITSDSAWQGTMPQIISFNDTVTSLNGQALLKFTLDREYSFDVPVEITITSAGSNKIGYLDGGNVKQLPPTLGNGTICYTDNTLYITKTNKILLYSAYLQAPTGGQSSGGGGGGNSGIESKPETPDVPENNPTEIKTKFSDIKEHWAHDSIVEMVELGYINGVSDTEFSPDTNITRSEFAAIIKRILTLPDAECSLSDVSKDDWFCKEVGAVVNAGLMKGSNGNFRPNDKITREEMAIVLINVYEKYVKTLDININKIAEFSDKDDISEWALSYVAKALDIGIIQGMGENTVVPKGNATRAQGVVMIMRLFKLINK